MKMLLVLALCLVVGIHAHVYDRGLDGRHVWKQFNFISTVMPRKGELDIRVASNGLLSMEAVVPRLKEQGIFLREITNGKTLLRLVYQNRDVLVDCDMERAQEPVDQFIQKFFKLSGEEDWREMFLEDVMERLRQGTNATFTTLAKNEPVPEQFFDMLSFDMMRYECKNLHREMRQHLTADNAKNGAKNGAKSDASPLLDNDLSDDGLPAPLKSRSKRSMFIYPGTNWCGKGSTASNYYDLGENIDTDKCCRAHDYCSVTIEGLTSQYNYFNYRLHTLSHCECDDQ